MRSQAVHLLLIILVLLSGSAAGHEGRPVFVQITTQPVGNVTGYEMQWKIPPVMARGQEPEVSLITDACTPLLRNAVPNRQKLIGKRIYRCTRSPSSMAISIDYPRSNPALSSLVVTYDALGNSQHILSAPEKTLIPIQNELTGFDIALQYSLGGIKHILVGFDHLLFVICLMVLAGTIPRILLTVTGFTLAHSVTLILSSLNWIAVPGVLIEILIALSIVLLAAEIIKAGKVGVKNTLSWRYPVVVASVFGLLHGFGFASVLGELGLPSATRITALLFFNLGIEIGQILFIMTMLLVVRLASLIIKPEARRLRLLNSGVYLIGVMASYWLLQRFFVMV
ncbi:MAG: HupE/UreJ family protein [Gammaproteobacteria bacterium]|nr:HupE/UreJ family protein [Gammaproteobacteria bacterium]